MRDERRIPRLAAGHALRFDPQGRSWVLVSPLGTVRVACAMVEVLRRCDGTRALDTVVMELCDSFGNPPSLPGEVHRFIDCARELGWVELGR